MKSVLKKILISFLSLLLVISLSGCQKKTERPTPSGDLIAFIGEVVHDILKEYEVPSVPEDPVIPEDPVPSDPAVPETPEPVEETLDEDGYYTSKEDVALYLHIYGHLPDNYLTKSEAKDLGWVASEGNLWDVTDHMSIGGDSFGNREGKLPKKKGRKYYECDIDYDGGTRNAKRIIYSNDGLIYYTGDHYNTFELLYGGEND